MLLLAGVGLGLHPLPPEITKFYEYVNLHNTKRQKIVYSLRDQKVYLLIKKVKKIYFFQQNWIKSNTPMDTREH
jgi:hypothetical protein